MPRVSGHAKLRKKINRIKLSHLVDLLQSERGILYDHDYIDHY